MGYIIMNKVRKSETIGYRTNQPFRSERLERSERLIKSERLISIDIVDALFSYYKSPIKNLQPYAEIGLRDLHSVIVDPKYFGRQTDHLRALDAPSKKAAKASTLDYVTFGGTFHRRDAHALKEASGLMCLDLDHLHNLAAKKRKLIADTFLNALLVFTSPSGDGLKVVIKNPFNSGNYSQDYKRVSEYVFRRFALQVDKTSNIAWACFICHDPEAWITPQLAGAPLISFDDYVNSLCYSNGILMADNGAYPADWDTTNGTKYVSDDTKKFIQLCAKNPTILKLKAKFDLTTDKNEKERTDL